MADLSISATISRTELALADLPLNDGTVHALAGLALETGRVQRRRNVAKSIFVHGGVEVDSIRDTTNLRLAVYTYGASLTEVTSRLNALIAAFSQYSYTLSFTIDGATLTYTCTAADYETGLTTPHMRARQVTAVFECPRSPGATL